MLKIFNRKTMGEMIRFAMVGVFSTILHYSIYWILQKYINPTVAYTVGYLLSFFANYMLTALFTFKKEKNVKNGIGFAGAHLCNYLLSITLLNVFIWLGVSQEYAPLPVYCIVVPINFFMVRMVFNKLK